MKQNYATPTILMNGNVVRETLSASPGPNEPIGLTKVEGCIGFNL